MLAICLKRQCFQSLLQIFQSVITSLTIIILASVTVTFSSKPANYYGRNFNFVVFHNPPYDFFIPGPNGTFSLKGATFNILLWLAVRNNFTYSLVPVNQTLADKKGVHEASFYQLINDESIEGIACPFYLTLDRKEKMDFTFLVWSEGFNLIVPRSGEESRLFAFIRPFQSTVWTFLLLSIIVVICVMTFFTKFYYKFYNNALGGNMDSNNTIITNQDEEHSQHGMKTTQNVLTSYFVGRNFIYIMNILTNQGDKEWSTRFSFRVLCGCWLLAAMVLVNSYSSIVISSLTVPKMMPTIESLEELAESKDVGIILRHDMVMGEQILRATSGIYKVLGDQARSNPKQIVGDHVKLNAMMETGRYAYPMIRTYCAFFIASQYKKEGNCRFKLSKRLTVSPGYYFLLMKRGSPFVKDFSSGLAFLWETGLTRKWINNNLPKADECFVNKRYQTSARQKPIQLSDLTSAFLILGIGLGFSILYFLFEIIQFHFS